MLEVRFLSSNEFKVAEAKQILAPASVSVIRVDRKIEELQTEDTNRLVKDKALKAFAEIGRPVFVEHTGLYLSYMNGLPGGLTQIFWDTLKADAFANIFGKAPDNSAIAKTVIGYIDGREFFIFEGEINGTIAPEPIGNRDFQWDCVFIPNGHSLTFAELGEKKNESRSKA
jgi:XTP/dITP diphosphohydrolase